jgi:hypothetical protein
MGVITRSVSCTTALDSLIEDMNSAESDLCFLSDDLQKEKANRSGSVGFFLGNQDS